jgi:hypothetical protein
MILKKIIFLCLFVILLNAKFIRDDNLKIILDTTSNLVWHDDTITQKTYTDAKAYCNNLSIDSYENWRVPNFTELYSIVDLTKSNPSINSVFQNISLSHFWTRTFNKQSNYTALWIISFSTGGTFQYNDPATKQSIRCVHDY